MAVKTTYELFDLLGEVPKHKTDGKDHYAIHATDKDGLDQLLIDDGDAVQFLKHNYGTRHFTVIKGAACPIDEGYDDWFLMYYMWLRNHRHGIDRMYQALYDYDYSPIENVDRYETETIDATDRLTYGHTISTDDDNTTTHGLSVSKTGTEALGKNSSVTRTGSESDQHGLVTTKTGSESLQHGETLTDTYNNYKDSETGSISVEAGTPNNNADTKTISGSKTVEHKQAGFDSPNSYTNASEDIESYSNYQEKETHTKDETTSYTNHDHTQTGSIVHGKSGTDTTTYNQVADTTSGTDIHTYSNVQDTTSGTDTTTYNVTDAQSGTTRDNRDILESHGGNDTNKKDSERELRVHGNIGVTMNTQLIDAELELRLRDLVAEIFQKMMDDLTYYS